MFHLFWDPWRTRDSAVGLHTPEVAEQGLAHDGTETNILKTEFSPLRNLANQCPLSVTLMHSCAGAVIQHVLVKRRCPTAGLVPARRLPGSQEQVALDTRTTKGLVCENLAHRHAGATSREGRPCPRSRRGAWGGQGGSARGSSKRTWRARR